MISSVFEAIPRPIWVAISPGSGPQVHWRSPQQSKSENAETRCRSLKPGGTARRTRRRVPYIRATTTLLSPVATVLCLHPLHTRSMTSKRPTRVKKAEEKASKRQNLACKSHRDPVKARSPASSKEKENATEPASQMQESRRTVTVHWSKPEYHFVTDLLLTAIEEHPPTCTALGFDLSEKDGSNKTNGKVVHEHYMRLARKVFLESGRFTKYTEDDLEDLASVVKNRVIRLKAIYRDCGLKLTETGAGLVDDDREDEIGEGSELANIWEAIQREFPWYKRVNELMRGHPMIDRSGVANSTTDIDVTILDRKQKDVESTSIHTLAPPSSPSGVNSETSPDVDFASDSDAEKSNFTDNDFESDSDLKGPAEQSQKRKSPPAAQTGTSTSKRRKNMLQHVQEIAAADREARLERMRLRLHAQHKYKVAKEKMRCDLERARLEHDARERDKQRAHELRVLEYQMELERIRHAALVPVGTQIVLQDSLQLLPSFLPSDELFFITLAAPLFIFCCHPSHRLPPSPLLLPMLLYIFLSPFEESITLILATLVLSCKAVQMNACHDPEAGVTKGLL
ncbi:hypothetical protein ACG7TL_002521 [Trametes sanguinea]